MGVGGKVATLPSAAKANELAEQRGSTPPGSLIEEALPNVDLPRIGPDDHFVQVVKALSGSVLSRICETDC